MAAKKKRSGRAKGPEKPQPAHQPAKASEQPEESPAAPTEAAQPEFAPEPSGPAVAGIGASAGGLDAFKKFFAAMPPDSGIAFVLVPHLDPAHESLMVELLARHTTMPVVEAENNMPVEANHVYIIAPNKYMTILDGVLRLTGPVERRTSQTSIDLFLRSLADDQQERSICIILSGTGSHGALGLKAVKAAGGMAMVQDPVTAEYERMPQSAIATGLADYVLPPEKMPDALIKYVRHAYVNGGTHIEAAPEAVDQLTQVLAILRTRSKFDFRAYRRKMLTRRIERRMGLNHFDSIPEYVTFLRAHPDELKLLLKDLLRRIGPARPERVDFPIVAATEVHGTARRPAESSGAPPTNFADVTQRLLLQEFAPAAVLINRKYEIFYYFGPCVRYLEIPTGHPTHDLNLMAREGLRTKLRGAVHRAIRENGNVALTDVQVKRNGNYYPVRVTVRPVQSPKAAESLLLITFEDEVSSAQSPMAPGDERRAEPGEESTVLQLEYELKATREDLQSTIEELESSNEELKASNEEVMSMNEELQSANEELETSKEELQSLNEELSTVNNQLQDKVQELETANNDISNLLNGTDVATVFLDSQLRIKLYTPNTSRLFNLIVADIGRPIRDIAPKFTDSELQRDAENVLRDLVPREREVRVEDGNWYLRRTTPYRTRDNRIDGVVTTFVDITERKRAADAIARRLAAIVESSADAIFSKDLGGTVGTWNQGAERLFGFSAEEIIGRSIRMTIPDDRAEEWSQVMARLARGESVEQMETERIRKDGRRVPIVVTYSPIRNAEGKVFSVSVIARDVGERKQAECDLRDREERLQAILDTTMDAIITIDYSGIIQSVNGGTERMFGYTEAEMIGQNVTMLMASPYREAHDGYIARYLQTGEKHIIGISREAEARRKDGSVFPVDLAVSEIKHLKLFTGVHRDLTKRKKLEREVVEVASLEQRRIGQDLHDTVAQELTALNLLARDLAETLRTEPVKASNLVEQMAHGLQRSQQELRAVLRGLLPVAVDSEGLMAALADLAERTQQEGKVTCTFDCPTPVSVADNLRATHLYLIAQEAVHNAVKHAQAHAVRISLGDDGRLVLGVRDNGVGMPPRPAKMRGLGLRIMRNRAAIIGATLTIKPAKPSGTMVTCTLARTNNAQKAQEPSPSSNRR